MRHETVTIKVEIDMETYSPDNLLDTNQAGIDLIKRWEKFMPNWYLCPANVWTIGYGTTERDTPGVSREELPGPITEEHAERLMKRELVRTYEPAVERLVNVPLTSNQFAALVSFTYNLGETNLRRSTLLRKLNREEYDAAATEFRKWVYANGKKLRGLVRRRRQERDLFLTPDTQAEPPDFSADVQAMPVLDVRPLPYNLPSWVTGPLRLA